MFTYSSNALVCVRFDHRKANKTPCSVCPVLSMDMQKEEKAGCLGCPIPLSKRLRNTHVEKDVYS